MYPRWYAFFYLTTRLGLRRGEVYAISRDRVREVPPLLVVDRAVQEGYKERRPKLITRKNDRVLTLGLPSDVVDAVRWHIGQGYSGPEFLFSQRRDLASEGQRPRGTAPRRAKGTRIEGSQPSQDRSPLGRLTGGHRWPVHQDDSGAARPPLVPQHGPIRAPEQRSAAPTRRVTRARGTASPTSARPPDVPLFTRRQAMSHASRGNHKPNARSSVVPGAGLEPVEAHSFGRAEP